MSSSSVSTRSRTFVEGNKSNDKQILEKKKSGILRNPVLGEEVNLETSRPEKKIPKRKLNTSVLYDELVESDPKDKSKSERPAKLYEKVKTNSREARLLSNSTLNPKAKPFEFELNI